MRYVTDMDTVKGLGFCVSKEHAHFVEEQFNAAGIASISLVGESKDEERKSAKDRLVKGEPSEEAAYRELLEEIGVGRK